jgi:uncharacterized protein
VPTRVGLISDTHGLLRPEAIDALAGCDRILHAGDVCDAAVLDALARIAPVVAVRGNNDFGAWADALPESASVRIEAVSILVVHDLAAAERLVAEARPDVVVSGHSHRPRASVDGGVLYVNPGSAGPRRFRLPVSVARLHVDGPVARAEIVELTVPSVRR